MYREFLLVFDTVLSLCIHHHIYFLQQPYWVGITIILTFPGETEVQRDYVTSSRSQNFQNEVGSPTPNLM